MEIYSEYDTRRKKRGGLIRVVDIIMLAASVVCSLLLVCSYLTHWVNPNVFWPSSMVGLVAPVLYIVNTIFALYWILRWKWAFIIPAIAIAAGIPDITLFFRPSLSKHYSEHSGRTLNLTTFNVMGFLYDDAAGNVSSSIEELAVFFRELNSDIVCMQEFQCKSAEQKHYVDSLFGMKYRAHNYIKENSAGGGWGLAIYSRYPIAGTGMIDYPSSNNSSMWADIVVQSDTVRVYNNHLQTTSVSFLDRQYISNPEFMADDPGRGKRMKGILGKLKRNLMVRAEQADSLARIIGGSPHKEIVCGDFNDTPMSYTYFRIRGELNDAFVKKGHGLTSNTFKGLFNLFRIDYVLYSKELEAVSYDTPENIYSDHKPVAVKFRLPLTTK